MSVNDPIDQNEEPRKDDDTLFQRYSHDKFLSTSQSDIESAPKPALRILRSTQNNKIAVKLRKILAE